MSAETTTSREMLRHAVATLAYRARKAMRNAPPDFPSFKIGDLMRSLEIEFAPIARAKALKLTFVPCSLPVESDRSLLRRLLRSRRRYAR